MSRREEALEEFRQSGVQFQKAVRSECEIMVANLVSELKETRKAQGLSQQDIADATGMRAPNITRVETMKSQPSLEILMRYAEALGYQLNLSLKPQKDEDREEK